MICCRIAHVFSKYPPPTVAKALVESASKCLARDLVQLQENLTADGWDVNQVMRQVIRPELSQILIEKSYVSFQNF